MDNIRKIEYEENNFIDVELILSEIKINYNNCYNNNKIEKSTQNESEFFVRKNAYIYKLLDIGNYLISIKLKNGKNKYAYNLRIGGEKEYILI